MDGLQDTATQEVREQPRLSRKGLGSFGSLLLIMAMAVALHGVLFSAFDLIAPLEATQTENVVLVVETPLHVGSFIADAR